MSLFGRAPIVLNKYHLREWPKGAVNIMRPGPLGNDFIVGRHGTRDECVDAHMEQARARIKTDPVFAAVIKDLWGRNLICCCKPKRCHGDNYVILCEELNQ